MGNNREITMRKLLGILLLLVSVGLSAQRVGPIAGNTFSGSSPNTLLTGLLGSWNMTDLSGAMVDNKGLNNGTNNSGAYNSGGVILANTGSVSIPYASNLVVSGANESIDIWVYFTSLPSTVTHNCYVYTETAADITSRIVVGTDNIIYGIFMNSTGTEFYVTSSSTVSASTWYHIVAICRGSGQTLQLYVNGTNVSTGADTFSGTLAPLTSSIILGNDAIGDPYGVTGQIKKANRWNKALSSTEVTDLYTKTYPW